MDLCTVLLAWAIKLTDYAPRDDCPELRMVPHEMLEEQACSGRSCAVLGWYPGEGDVVYLDQRMDIRNNLYHSSIALHEIVHWLQGHAGALLQDCDSSLAAEREAYSAQQLYLVEYGSYYPSGPVLPMLRCKPAPVVDSS